MLEGLIDTPNPLSLTEQYTGGISSQNEIQSSNYGRSKKKRARIVGDQLDQLERYFSVDRSPTAARRKEIGLQLGISERQIQIWFQNRRAKAKNTDEKSKVRVKANSVAPPRPPMLSQSTQTKLEELIEEEDTSIFIIPCTNLTIGPWRRVNCGTPPDLLAWFCEKKKCLTWFITSKEHSFKMQIPLEHISGLDFHNGDAGQGYITIDLIRAPGFYLRKYYHSHMGFSNTKSGGWCACDDWTEHREASRNFRHILGGAALPLAYVANYLKSHQRSFTQRPSSYSHSLDSSTPLSCTSYLKPLDHHYIEGCRPMVMDWGTSGLENQPQTVQHNDCKTYLSHNQPSQATPPNNNGLGGNHSVDDARDVKTSKG